MTGVAKNTVTKLLVDLGRRVRRLPGRDLREPALQAHPVRRDLGVLLRQGEERPAGAPGRVRLRRRVDVDRDRRRHQARPVLAGRATRTARTRYDVHDATWLDGSRNRVQLTTDGHKRLPRGRRGRLRRGRSTTPMLDQDLRRTTPRPRARYSPAVCIGADERT